MIAAVAMLFGVVFANQFWPTAAGSLMDGGIPKNERKKYIQLPLDNGASGIEIEFDSEYVVAALSTLVSELILVDVDCGVRDAHCPRFCATDFSADFEFLCEPTCRAAMSANWPTTCGDKVSSRYDGRRRPHSRLIAERQKFYPAGHRRIYGSLWTDEIAHVRNRWNFAKLKWSLRLNTTFVSARLSDKRLFYNGNAVFGLRPGENCAATSLAAAYGAQPLISVSHVRTADDMHLYYGSAAGMLTVGALDGVWCTDWKWTRSRSGRDAVAFAEVVDFMGVRFENVEIILDFLVGVMVLPNKTVEHLIEHKILRKYDESPAVQYFAYDCTDNPPIRFYANASDPAPFLEFSNKSMLLFKRDTVPPGHCGTSIVTDLTDPFSPERYGDVWLLGFQFMWAKCAAIDYATNAIGFAEQRMQAAIPMISERFYNHDHQREVPKPKGGERT